MVMLFFILKKDKNDYIFICKILFKFLAAFLKDYIFEEVTNLVLKNLVLKPDCHSIVS